MTRGIPTGLDDRVAPSRAWMIGGIMLVGMLCVVVRLFTLQVIERDLWRDRSQDLRYKYMAVSARRGTIYDASGHELALDKTAFSLYARPQDIEDPRLVAARLATVTGLSVEQVATRLAIDEPFVYLQRMVQDERIDEVRVACATLDGVGLETETHRAYPAETLAAALVGFTGVDHKGLAGLERTLDTPLAGQDGLMLAEVDHRGRPIPGRGMVSRDVVDGEDAYLTIDSDIQLACERELEECLETYQAKRATAIVIEPSTGAIRAAASLPSFDLNTFYEADEQLYQPMFSMMAYEPGSTMKPLMVAGALDSGSIDESSRFECRGAAAMGPERQIQCPFAPPGGHGMVAAGDIIEHSCNIGAMQIGFEFGNTGSVEYLERFGFLQNTGVEFDEVQGSIPEAAVRGPHWGATCAFGQAVTVTPLQMASAYAALANDGKLMRPYVVAERVSEGRSTVTEPEYLHRAVSAEVANAVVGMMTRVVESDEGTGTAARLQGIHVAGKTGTAEKFINGEYSKTRYIVSFVGMLPAEKPEYVILVVVDEPMASAAYGGMVAAPAFRDIAGSIVASNGLRGRMTAADASIADGVR